MCNRVAREAVTAADARAVLLVVAVGAGSAAAAEVVVVVVAALRRATACRHYRALDRRSGPPQAETEAARDRAWCHKAVETAVARGVAQDRAVAAIARAAIWARGPAASETGLVLVIVQEQVTAPQLEIARVLGIVPA
jgi:hypothetical protein